MSELCPTCNQILESYWVKHVKKKITNSWFEKTIDFFKLNSAYDFEIYKNSKGELYFIELEGDGWRETHGRYATIVSVNNLRKNDLTFLHDMFYYLMGCSFYYFYNKKEFKNEYKKLF
jgi:hypothetical protein